MKRIFIILLLSLLIIGCRKGIQEYQHGEIIKPVERIGPVVEKNSSDGKKETKPFELQMPKEKIPLPKRQTFELTERDLFTEKRWNPGKVSVFNITLGDSMDLILSTLGKPDEVIHHPIQDIVNIGYGPVIGLDKTGLFFHLVNKTLDRITIKQEFNQYLHGQTVINYTKKDIYEKFGIPQEQEDLPKFRIFRYSQGLEIIHTAKQMKAFVLTYPKKIDTKTNGKTNVTVEEKDSVD